MCTSKPGASFSVQKTPFKGEKELRKTSYTAVRTRLQLQSAILSLWLAARYRNGSGSMAHYSRVKPPNGSVSPDLHRNQAQGVVLQ